MAQREPPAKQQDRAPVRNVRSPGRRAYNTRLLSTRHHITVTNPHMSMAEASRIALKSVGPYVPSSQAAPSQQAATAATPKTAETARNGLEPPMTEITNAQDQAPLPSLAVRKAVEARIAKGGSASAAMSAYRHYASQTTEQLAQGSAHTQPPQHSSKANLLPPQLQCSTPQLQQQAMHPGQQQAEQTPVSDAAKREADKESWSAQLRAACHTLGQEHVTNLDAAKEELARALMYLQSTEHTLRGLKRQTEAVTGSLGLEWYLLREQRYIQSDIEAECARIATLACLIKNLEHGTQSD